MRKLALFMATVALVAVSVAAPALGAGSRTYTARLSGDVEVPTPTSSEATGKATFTLSKDGTVLSYKVTVSKAESMSTGVVQAYIHLGPVDVVGPVVVNLVPSQGVAKGVLAEGVITASNLLGPFQGQPLGDLIAEIEAGNTYVNVHTTAYPAGEIRGQIK
ncbi:MAG: CHRD domain-containing protein [Acidimicrobiia bacterium]